VAERPWFLRSGAELMLESGLDDGLNDLTVGDMVRNILRRLDTHELGYCRVGWIEWIEVD
jgi:hypothetical protein